MMLESLARGVEFAEIVRSYVEREVSVVRKELADVRAHVDALPTPKDGEKGEPGEPGRDGVAPTADDLRPILREMLDEAVAAIPPAKDGQKGDPGQDAPAPTDEQIEAAVAKWLEAHPPKDGEPGKDGKDGEKGEPGKDGADGVGLAGAFIDRDGNLMVTLTNGETRSLGRVEGRDGRDGIDGKDGANGEKGDRGDPGFALEDFEVEQIDLRTIVLSFTRGEVKESYEIALGGFVDRGVFKAGEAYELGDAVTWGGSAWIAQGPTTERPGEGSAAWRLAVKKGRDGKDADASPALKLIEDKMADIEARLMSRIEAFLKSKGL